MSIEDPGSWPRLAALARATALLVALAGCASTEVTSSHPYTGTALPRPDRILVYDFGATPAEVPAGSALTAEAGAPMPQTAQEVELGRKLGAETARQLTLDLRNAGLPAVQAAGQPPPQPGDIAIKGAFYGVNPGNEAKQLLIGFGAGAAELRTAVEAYEMTPAGLRPLGGGTSASGSGEKPGMVAPLAVFAATHNPIGLIVMGGIDAYDVKTGKTSVEGEARQTADEIAKRFVAAAQKQGWI